MKYINSVYNLFFPILQFVGICMLISSIQWFILMIYNYYCLDKTMFGFVTNIITLGSPICNALNKIQSTLLPTIMDLRDKLVIIPLLGKKLIHFTKYFNISIIICLGMILNGREWLIHLYLSLTTLILLSTTVTLSYREVKFTVWINACIMIPWYHELLFDKTVQTLVIQWLMYTSIESPFAIQWLM